MKGTCREKPEEIKTDDKTITLPPCRMRCFEKVSEEQRQRFHDHYISIYYWGLEDPQRRWDFVNSNIKVIAKQRTRKRKEESDQEKHGTVKRFIDNQEVCKTMFQNTLGISQQVLKTVLCKRDENGVIENDQRGKTGTKPSSKEDVIRHIKLFPVKDTHYCRSGTERRWLHEDLNLPKMQNLYIKWSTEQNLPVCKISYYRKIFNAEFNLSFHTRKKDKCQLCEDFDHSVTSKEKKRLMYREQDNWKEMDYSELIKVEIEVDEAPVDNDDSSDDGEEVEQRNSDVDNKKKPVEEASEELQKRILEGYRFHIKEVELSRKLKLRSKTNSASAVVSAQPHIVICSR